MRASAFNCTSASAFLASASCCDDTLITPLSSTLTSTPLCLALVTVSLTVSAEACVKTVSGDNVVLSCNATKLADFLFIFRIDLLLCIIIDNYSIHQIIIKRNTRVTEATSLMTASRAE